MQLTLSEFVCKKQTSQIGNEHVQHKGHLTAANTSHVLSFSAGPACNTHVIGRAGALKLQIGAIGAGCNTGGADCVSGCGAVAGREETRSAHCANLALIDRLVVRDPHARAVSAGIAQCAVAQACPVIARVAVPRASGPRPVELYRLHPVPVTGERQTGSTCACRGGDEAASAILA